jgi:hypothetical protein
MNRSQRRAAQRQNVKTKASVVQAPYFNLYEYRLLLGQSVKIEKADGRRIIWYEFNADLGDPMCWDNPVEVTAQLVNYAAQGLTHYKDIAVDGITCKQLGCLSATIKVYRNEGVRYWGGSRQDYLSAAMGYIPASCEVVMIEMILQ